MVNGGALVVCAGSDGGHLFNVTLIIHQDAAIISEKNGGARPCRMRKCTTEARTTITAGRVATAGMLYLRGAVQHRPGQGALSTISWLLGWRSRAVLSCIDFHIWPGTGFIRRPGSRGTACRSGPHSVGTLYNPYAYYSIITIKPQINNFRTGFWGFGVMVVYRS